MPDTPPPRTQTARIGRMEAGAARSRLRCWAVWDGPACVARHMTRQEAVAFHAGFAWGEARHRTIATGSYRRAWEAGP